MAETAGDVDKIDVAQKTAMHFHDLTAKTIDGQDFPFSQLIGKVVLIVNVASKCGFTSQYTGLEHLYQKYKEKDFVILGFPCNQFGGQEPGTESEIVEFCSRKYNVSFQMMQKVDVNGDWTHPVYAYLKREKKQMFMERIKWNFEKFLVDKKGLVVERFSSVADPFSSIEPLLLSYISA